MLGSAKWVNPQDEPLNGAMFSMMRTLHTPQKFATAGIEREIKLYVPLSPLIHRGLKQNCERHDITLSYFKPKLNLKIIVETLYGLQRLVVDGDSYSVAELRNANVKMVGLGVHKKYSIELQRLTSDSEGPKLTLRDIEIKRSLFRKLNRETSPEKRSTLILKSCGPVLIEGERFGNDDFVSARVRKVVTESGNEYFVDLKGKRHGSHRINRAELSIPIPAREYSRLAKLSDGGTIAKTRYSEHGVVRTPQGDVHVRAEADVLHDSEPFFTLVEIELPRGVSRNAVMKSIRDRTHSLSVLAGKWIPMSFKARDGSDALGMRRLAAVGIDDRALAVVAAFQARIVKLSEVSKRRTNSRRA